MSDVYDTNEKLLAKVQTGKGDLEMYDSDNNYLDIEGIFGSTEPETIEQRIYLNPSHLKEGIGKNNLLKAKAAQYTYFVSQNRLEDINENAYLGFE